MHISHQWNTQLEDFFMYSYVAWVVKRSTSPHFLRSTTPPLAGRVDVSGECFRLLKSLLGHLTFWRVPCLCAICTVVIRANSIIWLLCLRRGLLPASRLHPCIPSRAGCFRRSHSSISLLGRIFAFRTVHYSRSRLLSSLTGRWLKNWFNSHSSSLARKLWAFIQSKYFVFHEALCQTKVSQKIETT